MCCDFEGVWMCVFCVVCWIKQSVSIQHVCTHKNTSQSLCNIYFYDRSIFTHCPLHICYTSLLCNTTQYSRRPNNNTVSSHYHPPHGFLVFVPVAEVTRGGLGTLLGWVYSGTAEGFTTLIDGNLFVVLALFMEGTYSPPYCVDSVCWCCCFGSCGSSMLYCCSCWDSWTSSEVEWG